MAKKSELLKKKWSQLSKSEKAKFKSKSTFSGRKQAQLTINQTTPKKPKKAAVTAIQQDKGKLKPKDIKRISEQTGLSSKKITRLAINKVPDKTVSKKVDTSGADRETRADLTEGKGKKGAIKQLAADGRLGDKDIKFLTKNYPGLKASDIRTFLNRDKNSDVKGPKSNIKNTIRGTRTPGKTETGTGNGEGNGTGNGKGNGTGNGKGNGTGNGKGNGFDPDYEPLGDIEFPKGTSGKDFKKYEPQRGKIRKAAEKDLKNRMEEGFKPKVLGEAADLKKEFLGDPTKPREKLTGRAKLKDRIQQVKERQKELGIRRKPKFEDYQQRVQDIRDSTGPDRIYSYSTRFGNLGRKLGVEYGTKERRERTKKRLSTIGSSLSSPYQTRQTINKDRREKGRKAMESFKIG